MSLAPFTSSQAKVPCQLNKNLLSIKNPECQQRKKFSLKPSLNQYLLCTKKQYLVKNMLHSQINPTIMPRKEFMKNIVLP